MRVSGKCGRCGRTLLASQVAEAGGRCPACGHRFHPHYAPLLVQALRRLDAAGTALEEALARALELGFGFQLDPESILGPLRLRLEGESGAVQERTA